MLKRLRWKFIGYAMLAFAIVMAVLVTGINLAYRYVVIGNQDRLLTIIASNEGRIPEYSPRQQRRHEGDGFRMTPETPFETRFFVVWEDDGSGVTKKQLDFIAAVTGEDAEAYYRRAGAQGRDEGFVGSYRYLRSQGREGVFYVFLDSTRQMASLRNLLLVSVLITCFALCATFALVYALSGKAIEPTVRAIESQKRFITDASHEIKTPLTIINSYADVLCMEEEQNEWARGIQKESRRLSRLVSNLVMLSRWDEEFPQANRQEFDFSRALWDTLAPYQHLAETQGKALEADIADGLRVNGDESALQTAAATLLENAVQYSLPGSAVTVRACGKKRSVCLDIANACELPEDLPLERLFDRFYRSDPSRARSSGGNGVGLSLAKAIVEAHGGKISAQRGSDGRLCFQIVLPE